MQPGGVQLDVGTLVVAASVVAGSSGQSQMLCGTVRVCWLSIYAAIQPASDAPKQNEC